MSQPPHTGPTRAAERGPQSVVCAGISALVRERWGRGPSRSRAYWAGPDVLLVILDDAHTEAERTLLLAGHGEQVLAGRRLLWDHAGPELRRIARKATGRPVRGLLSQSSLDPVVSTLAFLFESEAPERDEPLGESLQQALGQTSAAHGPRPPG